MSCEIHETQLDLVKALMDTGRIGALHGGDQGTMYGDEKHLNALACIEEHIKAVREKIAKFNNFKDDDRRAD